MTDFSDEGVGAHRGAGSALKLLRISATIQCRSEV